MASGSMSDRPALAADIRPWAEGDHPLLERLLGDPAMTRYLGGPESSDQIRKRHQRYVAMSDSGNGCIFVVTVGPEASGAGSVGYWEKDWRGQVVWETGWSVLPEFQGMGIATQGMARLIDRARADSLHRYMHAFPAVENAPSNALCRKLGFRLLGALDFEYPPGNLMRCNDWQLDLMDDSAEGGL